MVAVFAACVLDGSLLISATNLLVAEACNCSFSMMGINLEVLSLPDVNNSFEVVGIAFFNDLSASSEFATTLKPAPPIAAVDIAASGAAISATAKPSLLAQKLTLALQPAKPNFSPSAICGVAAITTSPPSMITTPPTATKPTTPAACSLAATLCAAALSPLAAAIISRLFSIIICWS